jgi:hemerythrin superfamily protein
MANSIDTIVSKGTGAVKGVEARLSGLVGVFMTLSKQHGEAKALLESVQKDAGKRAELWPTIRKELMSHEKAEMSEVYPELREHGETSVLADRHDEEAGDLEKQIKKLDALDLNSAEWGTAFEKLTAMVLQHATEEEKTIFPVAQETLGDDEAKNLDKKFQAAQKRLKETL